MNLLIFANFLMGALPATTAPNTHVEHHGYTEIHTDRLKSWYDQNKHMTIIDARSKPYFDGVVLPHAKWVSYEVTDNELQAALPSKYDLIVVYCWSEGCPASKYMADRLVAAGYKNVYKYPEGLVSWMEKKHPTEKH